MPNNIILAPAIQWSGALRRKLNTDTEFGEWLSSASKQALSRQTVYAWFEELKQQHCKSHVTGDYPTSIVMGQILRLLRQRVFFCLMVRDLNGSADLTEVIGAMTALADLAISQAYAVVSQELVQRFGTPTDPNTKLPQELIIVGMGKLGGRELNVSSDIDLIMLYAYDGTTNGSNPISNHEFYNYVVRGVSSLLSDYNAFGYVFRCDLRLRPDGDAGALAWSLKAFEKYVFTQGREWERYAWIKARVIPCKAFPLSEPQPHINKLESIRKPFIYRKYLDFDALTALREVRQRIRRDWESRAVARTAIDKTQNIKLGDGGIREIEFIVQLNQLIRGGRMPSLQQRNLLAALQKQVKAGLLPADTAIQLEQAYKFMRRLEHVLQYREDEQTHIVPNNQEQLQSLAHALEMEVSDFETILQQHKNLVNQTFTSAFRLAGINTDHAANSSTSTNITPTHTNNSIHTELEQAVAIFMERRKIKYLPPHSQQRLTKLLPTAVKLIAHQANAVTTLQRLLDLLEHIAQRSSYLALLSEYPDTLNRLLNIISASPWAAQYLAQYPLLLDSLIAWKSLMKLPDYHHLAQQLSADLDACTLADGNADIELQMNLMRDLQHQISFQLLAQDLEGELSVEALADHLSALADLMLEETIKRAWPHQQAPKFAVIAYGKLGGKELGYVSDLDLVFLYDDSSTEAAHNYTRLGRRMVSWLSALTPSGRLYEVDLRLRPDGEAGLLAVSINAFEQYQLKHAWTWEHQALTRARFAAGNKQIGERFETLRAHILMQPREPEKLKSDIKEMREKISSGHPNHSNFFDIKHDQGGMVDVEFIVQYLVLCYAHQYKLLLGNLGNIALLRIAAEVQLIPQDMATNVADAYRLFRKKQHELRLQGAERARVAAHLLQTERKHVQSLWNYVLQQ